MPKLRKVKLRSSGNEKCIHENTNFHKKKLKRRQHPENVPIFLMIDP